MDISSMPWPKDYFDMQLGQNVKYPEPTTTATPSIASVSLMLTASSPSLMLTTSSILTEDNSGFIGYLSSTESEFSEPEKSRLGDDESSSGQDRFNEVDEVVVRFKAQARGPEFVNEAFEARLCL